MLFSADSANCDTVESFKLCINITTNLQLFTFVLFVLFLFPYFFEVCLLHFVFLLLIGGSLNKSTISKTKNNWLSPEGGREKLNMAKVYFFPMELYFFTPCKLIFPLHLLWAKILKSCILNLRFNYLLSWKVFYANLRKKKVRLLKRIIHFF